MIFHDVTLIDGRVHSRRRWDTRELAPWAIEVCADLLKRLRAGEDQVEHGQEGLPPFWVALGLPTGFPEAAGNDLFFCVGARGHEAFQFNVVIHPDTEREPGLWGLTTALGISRVADPRAPFPVTALEETVAPLYDERPLLATALLPVAGAAPATVHVAADFSTCFAAAWLLEAP